MSSKKQPRSLKEDFLSRLSRNKRHLIALGVLFILPLILYSAIFFGGQKFFGTDVLQWRAGAESIIEYKAEHGENPLWATNMFSGMPAYTISQPEPVPNFDTFIRAISGDTYPLPFYWVLLGGLYLFFVIQGFRPLSSTIGSIFIGFTTYLPIIIEAGHYNKFVAFAFIPWMLVGYWMLSRSNKKWLGMFIFALAVTLELRANHPQVTYYFLYLLGFWWLFDAVFEYRRDQLKQWGMRTALMIGAGLLGIVCSLEGYLTLYEYAQYSTRSGSTLAGAGGGLDLEYAFRWSQGFGELLTLIISGIFGGASGEAYWGPKPFTSGPHYLGAIAFLLALIGLFRYKKNIKYLFFGVGVLTMLFSLGHHFRLLNQFMFNYMPWFNKFRTPEMWLIVSVFCFSVLAVYGIHALTELARQKKKSLQPFFVPVGIALFIGLLFAFANEAVLSYEKPGERQQLAQQVAQQNNVSPQNPQVQQRVSQFINNRIKPERREMAQSDSIRYLILVLLAGGLIFAFYRQKVSVGLFMAGLIVLSAYDMLSVAGRYINEENLVSDDYETEQLLKQQERPIDTFIRKNIQAENKPYPYRVFPLLSNPFNNAVPAYFYPSIGGYSGAKLAYYQDFIDAVLMKDGSIHMPALDMLNVKYVTYNQPLPFPNMEQVYSQNNRVVMENTDVLPKAFFVDSVVTVSSPQEAVNQINSASFNPAEWAVVESSEKPAAQADTAAQVQVTEYQANEITLQTDTEQPGFLVLSEIWYPAGWEAQIDGESARIYKTNFILRGIEVPAGQHKINLTFQPDTVYIGSLFSWIGHGVLLCLGIGVLVMTYRNRKNEREPTP